MGLKAQGPLATVCQRLGDTMDAATGAHCATVLWALARLELYDAGVFDKLLTKVEGEVQKVRRTHCRTA